MDTFFSTWFNKTF